MQKSFYSAGAAALALSLLAAVATANPQQGKSDEKSQPPPAAPATRTLKVKLNYSGAGKVDASHKIQVFLFDSPEFVQGNVMPIGMKDTTSKDGTVEFADITTSPVYAVSVYDPKGEYDGMSGPPPSGASLGMYTKEPPKPGAIAIEAGKTVQVDLPFDDTAKMP